MLDRRSQELEIMDDASQTEAQFHSALVDLERMTKMTLGYWPTLRFMDRVLRATQARRLTVLDVGAGGGDMIRKLAAWGETRGVELEFTAIDHSPWAISYARAKGTPGRWIDADVFALPEQERFDVVLCSIFTHHLRDEELVRFLRWIELRAKRAWMISDIHRHWIAYAGTWALVHVLPLDPMVVNDSVLSIARSFTREDWERLLAEAGVEAEIRWAFPFRWTVSSIRPW
jgi:2-polyprenyl-3-methyl-5-hydroxy-6-metoxy-1,4-benzoquinol methylase